MATLANPGDAQPASGAATTTPAAKVRGVKPPKKVPMGPVGPDTVYQATYSGVPVYELILNKEIVMRRRGDDWLNATQFLKVANFDKPQRTRILEREVQKGEHEKIQGGYGKSQGTWVPFERGVALAKQYNIEHLIRPLLEIDVTRGSPPPAPKHQTAAPRRKEKVGVTEGDPLLSGTAGIGLVPTGRKKVNNAGGGGSGRGTPVMNVAPSVAQPYSTLNTGGGNGAGHMGMSGLAGSAMPRGSTPDHMDHNSQTLNNNNARRSNDTLNHNLNHNRERELSPDEGDFTDAQSGSSSSRTPSPMPQNSHLMSGSLNDHMQAAYDPLGFMGDGGQGQGQGQGQKRKSEGEEYDEPASQRARLDEDGGGNGVGVGGGNGNDIAGSSTAGQNGLAGLYAAAQHQQSQQHQPGLPLNSASAETYGNIILDYFITEKARIPDCLIDPPRDFDPNVPIDDDGHTALHWACAMGRLRVVKLLISAGADIFRVNHSEQTALMRSVMFSNNYDVRKFPELYQLLHRSTLNIDKHNRTVFHHIADVALTKGKTHAARYYMETILSHLEDFPRELEDVINFQDEDGETALTLAARARSKRLVKALLDHGADPKIKNRDHKSAEDYILEDERFRSSPQLNAKLGFGEDGQPIAISAILAPQLYHSHAAQSTAGRITLELTSQLDGLAQAFDGELQAKEKDAKRAEGLLATLKQDIAEARRVKEELLGAHGGFEPVQTRVEELKAELAGNMGRKYQQGWQSWLKEYDDRRQEWESKGRPDEEQYRDLVVGADEAANAAEEQLLLSEIEKSKGEREAMFAKFVHQQTESGTGETMASYRRLVASACGGLPPSQADSFLSTVLETLEGGGAAQPNGVSTRSDVEMA